MVALEFGAPRSLGLRAAWTLLEKATKGLFCQTVIIPLFSRHRILSQVAGHEMYVIKLLPPLCLSQADEDWIVEAFDDVIADCHKMPERRLGPRDDAGGARAQEQGRRLSWPAPAGRGERSGRFLIGACIAAAFAWRRPARAAHMPGAAASADAAARRRSTERARLLWIDRPLGAGGGEGPVLGRRLGRSASARLASAAWRPCHSWRRRTAIDWYTSAATAAIGVMPLLVSPLAVTRDAPKLRAAVAAAPLDDEARVCALLVDAEGKLAADAADERWQQGWWIHAGNIAFNTGVLLFLGLGYHHWTSGIINGVAGAAVGEAIILTQPTGAIDDLGAYNRGDLSVASESFRARRGFRSTNAATLGTLWTF